MFKVPDWEDAPNNLNFTKALPVSQQLGLFLFGGDQFLFDLCTYLPSEHFHTFQKNSFKSSNRIF